MMEGLVRQFLYHPLKIDADKPVPSDAGACEEVWLETDLGHRVHGLYWQAKPERPTVLFLHGNAQSVYEWYLIRDEMAAMNCGMLLLDYPGYGKSGGKPSEEGLYAAGHAAYDYLLQVRRIPEEMLVVFGKSLGGGVTTQIVQGRKPLGVVLESTFRSIPNVIRRLMPMVPRLTVLKSERYESIERIAAITSPVFVIHGEQDEIIPLSEGQALFAAANEPKQLWIVPSAGHNDVALCAGVEYDQRLRAWLDEVMHV